MKIFTFKFYLYLAGLSLLLICLYCYVYLPQDHLSETESDGKQRETTSVSLRHECHQRKSVANMTNFASYPPNMKTFLYYRHCRHFPLLLHTPGKCGRPLSNDVFLLLIVRSSPGNYERREVLRKTWAQEREVKGRWVRRIFITGTTGGGFEKIRTNKLLKVEQEEHNDIMQWDLQDSLINLTLKQALVLEWLEENCKNAKFLFSGDDDEFAHTENIVEYLKSLGDDDGSKHLFTGYLLRDSRPFRDKHSKYFAPREIYHLDRYPPFCSGGGILMSRYTALVIHKTSQSIPLFPMDDVYLGIILAKAGLNLTAHPGVRTFGIKINSPDEFDPCFFKDLLLVHSFKPKDLFILWHRLHDPELKCL